MNILGESKKTYNLRFPHRCSYILWWVFKGRVPDKVTCVPVRVLCHIYAL